MKEEAMGIEDEGCDTGLALGLRPLGRSTKPCRQQPPLEPSLTLSLPDEVVCWAAPAMGKRLSSPHSTVSSLSTTANIKKERAADVGGGDEAEVERGSSRASDEDMEEALASRKKLRLTKEQSALLEDRFKEHTSLVPKQKQALAKQLNLQPRQVEVWFQNRRARTKLKQTEVDCELLRRCCETLTEENRRLQKELQELKLAAAAAAPAPLFMQLPSASLTLCPSCERISDGSGGGGGKADSMMMKASKPHFFNPFTHSAAC